MDKNNGFDCDASDYAWSIFTKTGDISYYLLYKNLKKK